MSLGGVAQRILRSDIRHDRPTAQRFEYMSRHVSAFRRVLDVVKEDGSRERIGFLSEATDREWLDCP